MKSDISIKEALDSAFEMSVGPGMYMLSADPYMRPECGPGPPGVGCTATYGVAANVDASSDLSGRQNRFPRGLYEAPPLPEKRETVVTQSLEPPPSSIHKSRGSLRGLTDGPAGSRMGSEWLGGVDIQDPRHFVFEITGFSRGGLDARQMAKDRAA